MTDDTLKREIERRMREALPNMLPTFQRKAVAVALEVVKTEHEAHLACHHINSSECVKAAVQAERERCDLERLKDADYCLLVGGQHFIRPNTNPPQSLAGIDPDITSGKSVKQFLDDKWQEPPADAIRKPPDIMGIAADVFKDAKPSTSEERTEIRKAQKRMLSKPPTEPPPHGKVFACNIPNCPKCEPPREKRCPTCEKLINTGIGCVEECHQSKEPADD